LPIIHIKSLPPKKYVEISKALSNLCIRVADELGIDENKVWATWQELQPEYYVEGSKTFNEQPTSTHPPLVEVLGFEGKKSHEIEKILNTIAKNLSELFKVDPENIFISYKECLKGKTFSAGLILK